MLIAMLLLSADPGAVRCRGVRLEDAVADLAHRTEAMDNAGVAALFGRDGQSVMGGKTLTGSAAIARFLSGFSGFHVNHEAMTVTAADRRRAGWRTRGSFDQRGTTPDGSAYHAHGRFAIDWRCDAKAGWRVRRMQTWSD